MIRNFRLVAGCIISHFYMGTALPNHFKTIFLRCLIISFGVIGIVANLLSLSHIYHNT